MALILLKEIEENNLITILQNKRWRKDIFLLRRRFFETVKKNGIFYKAWEIITNSTFF
jgi:hypothetical protein